MCVWGAGGARSKFYYIDPLLVIIDSFDVIGKMCTPSMKQRLSIAAFKIKWLNLYTND